MLLIPQPSPRERNVTDPRRGNQPRSHDDPRDEPEITPRDPDRSPRPSPHHHNSALHGRGHKEDLGDSLPRRGRRDERGGQAAFDFDRT